MAEPAQNLPHKSNSGRITLSPIQHMAIRMYADGKTRSQVALVLREHLTEYGDIKRARKVLRKWEETQWFRDAVYDYSLMKAEISIPQILNGVTRKAKKGRVDASRLILEVTGRHNPRGEPAAPAVVQINLGGAIPRPSNRSIGPADAEGELVSEEDVDES